MVQSTGDTGVFPSDAMTIHAALGSADKQLQMVPGAHYFEAPGDDRDAIADLLSGWIAVQHG